ncbi:unnamed protein product [marine sediment metagenome]|uniref:Uncharacterized protein n=1 Tax=marine sediment metagenome TaxID=412755 RepID=X1K381_9ZZZZ
MILFYTELIPVIKKDKKKSVKEKEERSFISPFIDALVFFAGIFLVCTGKIKIPGNPGYKAVSPQEMYLEQVARYKKESRNR